MSFSSWNEIFRCMHTCPPPGNTLFFFWYLYSSSPGNINEAQIELRKTFSEGKFPLSWSGALSETPESVDECGKCASRWFGGAAAEPDWQTLQSKSIFFDWMSVKAFWFNLYWIMLLLHKMKKRQRTVNYTALTQFYQVKLKAPCYTYFMYPFSHFSSL